MADLDIYLTRRFAPRKSTLKGNDAALTVLPVAVVCVDHDADLKKEFLKYVLASIGWPAFTRVMLPRWLPPFLR